MGQKKLVRFAAIKEFANVLQYPEGIKGNWHKHFGNAHPITLELACGKGEYSIGLGREHKDRNFIGVDIKGNRIFIGAKKALAEGMSNVAFLRAQIQQLPDYFAPDEVSEIWIVFPDPFLRDGKAKNRLTHPRFLREYQKVLPASARIQLKTDSKELYTFTQEVIAEQACTVHADVADIYGKGLATGPLAIQTFYEGMHRAEGRTIYYPQLFVARHAHQRSRKKEKRAAGMSLLEGEDYYLLPDGRLVMTAAYLLKRGWCCGNGCLNCPYDYAAVPEPKRTLLLASRNNKSNSDGLSS